MVVKLGLMRLRFPPVRIMTLKLKSLVKNEHRNDQLHNDKKEKDISDATPTKPMMHDVRPEPSVHYSINYSKAYPTSFVRQRHGPA
jgi:hypothetical protein